VIHGVFYCALQGEPVRITIYSFLDDLHDRANTASDLIPITLARLDEIYAKEAGAGP
jgi:hypothetical protein